MPGTLQSDLDLLIGQWQGSEKLGALIQVYRDIVVEDIIPAFETLRDMRKIESAVGVHLEYLGRRLGVGRPSTTDPSEDSRFGFDDAGTGFDQAPFRGARANDAVYPLPDAVYRQFLRARAITLLSDGSIEALKASVLAIDPGAAVRDRRNMTVNGGGIMLHAERPDGPVAAAQKCAIHGPLSVATRGGGCTAWSSMRRFDWRLSTRV